LNNLTTKNLVLSQFAVFYLYFSCYWQRISTFK